MNPSERPEVLRGMDPVQGHRGRPALDSVPQQPRPDEQTPPRDPVGPQIPDDATETFVGGAGI